jgi:hypothetical protein
MTAKPDPLDVLEAYSAQHGDPADFVAALEALANLIVAAQLVVEGVCPPAAVLPDALERCGAA